MRSLSLGVSRSFVVGALLVGVAGCSSFGKTMKGLVGGDTKSKRKVTRKASGKMVGKIDKSKNYRRVDHQSLQEESRLGADSGSLWIERGQGSYLFTQNTNRLIGDLVNVEIQGHPKKQIETKVKVIRDLIDKIKAQAEARKLAKKQKREARKRKKGRKLASAPPTKGPPKAAKKQDKFDVKIVPSRIVEIMKDGSYMVKGEQPFMIDRREYKLIVKGIVRQEDFDDQGIESETLLDPTFDIVTNRKKGRIR